MNPAAMRVSGFTEELITGKTHREAGFESFKPWEDDIHLVFASGRPASDYLNGRVLRAAYPGLASIAGARADGGVELVLGVSRHHGAQTN